MSAFEQGDRVRAVNVSPSAIEEGWFGNGDTGTVLSIDRHLVRVRFDKSPTRMLDGEWWALDSELEHT